MKFKHIDIHAHLNFEDFDDDRDQLIERAKEKNLAIINIGTDIDTSREVLDLAQKHENIFAIVGFHPIYVGPDFDFENNFSVIEKMLEENAPSKNGKANKVVGIGECGLDYFHINETDPEKIAEIKTLQEKVFRAQIEMAIKHEMPIMIHCRDAYSEVLKILEEYKSSTDAEKLRGNIHFFAGTKEHAQKFLDLGFTISFTGVITFAEQYRELVEFVPMDKIHAETDSPYVAPAPNRGKRNEPEYSILVAQKIAEIKGLDFEEVREQLVENAIKTFNLRI